MAATNLQRAAWHALLSVQPHLHVMGSVGRVAEAAHLIVPEQPAALLLDSFTPNIEMVRTLRATSHAVGILVLVAEYDVEVGIALLQFGATGCIAYDAAVGDLARSLIAVARGEIVFPAHLAAQVLMQVAGRASANQRVREALSERENDVLRLLAQGFTNKDIAQTLVLSVRTVESHLRMVYNKIGVRSRTEAALWAIRHGFGNGH